MTVVDPAVDLIVRVEPLTLTTVPTVPPPGTAPRPNPPWLGPPAALAEAAVAELCELAALMPKIDPAMITAAPAPAATHVFMLWLCVGRSRPGVGSSVPSSHRLSWSVGWSGSVPSPAVGSDGGVSAPGPGGVGAAKPGWWSGGPGGGPAIWLGSPVGGPVGGRTGWSGVRSLSMRWAFRGWGASSEESSGRGGGGAGGGGRVGDGVGAGADQEADTS